MSKKPLPNVAAPVLSCKLPVSGKKVKYRPFLVKEQKALLLAQQSEDEETIYDTIKSVIAAASNDTVEFDTIPVADLAYFFLQLRIASVGPEVNFTMPCTECETAIDVQLMLDQITVEADTSLKTVNITETVGIVFRYPTLADSYTINEDDEDASIRVIYNLIENVYDEDQIYKKSDYTEDEFKEWLLSLNESQVLNIDKFVASIPELTHTFEATCPSCGTKQSRSLVGLQSFFRLGNAS